MSSATMRCTKAANFLSVDESTVRENVKDDIFPHLTEDILREALEGLPGECAEVVEEIREERIFASWSDDERGLLKRLRALLAGRDRAVAVVDRHPPAGRHHVYVMQGPLLLVAGNALGDYDGRARLDFKLACLVRGCTPRVD